jgi:hypothetical protein
MESSNAHLRSNPRRIAIDADSASQGLGRLIVAVLELLRDLMERQALRRVEGGGLSADEVERLGQALLALDVRFDELRELLTADENERLVTGDRTRRPGGICA